MHKTRHYVIDLDDVAVVIQVLEFADTPETNRIAAGLRMQRFEQEQGNRSLFRQLF